MRLSVVIPALDEAACVASAVESAWTAGAHDVLVADGGSADGTPQIARDAGAEVLHTPRGRAVQQNTAAAAATGDVLLFLHADTTLPPDAAQHIARARDAGAESGCFRLRFRPSTPLLRLYAAVTHLPIPWLVYGDRGLWCTRAAFDAVGGLPEMPAFEDVAFVRALHRRGTFRFVPAAVTTSARRFVHDGIVRRQLHNAWLTAQYWAGVSPERLARAYRYGRDRG